ncbi:MAG: phosphodiester glycosidase family protein [Armatimonadota bacterium]
MKRYLLIALLLIALGLLTSRSVIGFITVKVVRLDPAKVEMHPVLAKKGGESFAEMVARLRPHAAVNGTYYDEKMRPLGDVVAGGRLVNRGCYRNAVAMTPGGRIDFLHTEGRLRWRGYRAGLAAGPRLVHGGKVALDPVSDGFSSRSLTVRAPRTGIGRTKDGKLLLVVAKQRITLSKFARLMLDLGAVEAMNLDGGGACALYQDGKTLANPQVQMTNILTFRKR